MKLRSVITLLALLLLTPALAMTLNSTPGTLIDSIHYFADDYDAPLSFEQAQARFDDGNTSLAEHHFLTFGLNDHAAWVKISIDNPSDQTINQRLTTGQIWVDELDVYLVHNGQTRMRSSGDAFPADGHLLPTVGFVFDVALPPGHSDIYIRGASHDPLVLPLSLDNPSEARRDDTRAHITSGLLYGILITLVGLNAVLYTSFKQRHAFYYATYISSFILLNLGYSGYGFSWLFPNSPNFQNDYIIFMMIIHGVCGLLFMRNFLSLKQTLPRIHNTISLGCLLTLIYLGYLTLTGQQLAASQLAFVFLTITTCSMILIGVLSLGKSADARYFLLAVSCSMLGVLSTLFSVWGVIPYTFTGFHGAEIGVVCEAVILAVIVAKRLKAIEKERITAKFLANYDPLTQLNNRHAFERKANRLLKIAQQNKKPLSLIMLDLDHFKAVNDTYGHQSGDAALKHVAQLLRNVARTNDVTARWGGEEMVWLLPNCSLNKAIDLAETLRQQIAHNELTYDHQTLNISASFGVASSQERSQLPELFQLTDERLYQAKRSGRNQVVGQHTQTAEPSTSAQMV